MTTSKLESPSFYQIQSSALIKSIGFDGLTFALRMAVPS
jgi:hypothetical protein